jgi:hypothetical protein
MNDAERKRDVRIVTMSDVDLLRALVGDPYDCENGGTGAGEDLTDDEAAAFIDMLMSLTCAESERRNCLSRKQRTWAEEVMRRVTPVQASDAPRGKEVPLPAALQHLPKLPPGRT